MVTLSFSSSPTACSFFTDGHIDVICCIVTCRGKIHSNAVAAVGCIKVTQSILLRTESAELPALSWGSSFHVVRDEAQAPCPMSVLQEPRKGGFLEGGFCKNVRPSWLWRSKTRERESLSAKGTAGTISSDSFCLLERDTELCRNPLC